MWCLVTPIFFDTIDMCKTCNQIESNIIMTQTASHIFKNISAKIYKLNKDPVKIVLCQLQHLIKLKVFKMFEWPFPLHNMRFIMKRNYMFNNFGHTNNQVKLCYQLQEGYFGTEFSSKNSLVYSEKQCLNSRHRYFNTVISYHKNSTQNSKYLNNI